MKRDEMDELIKRYEPLIRKEVAKFASLQITYDELMSEAYYIMARIIKKRQYRLKGFPVYLKKTLYFGLLRYVVKERERRNNIEYR